jgi:WD40 repeat protein
MFAIDTIVRHALAHSMHAAIPFTSRLGAPLVCRKAAIIVGDHTDVFQFDLTSNRTITCMAGHRDWGFAAAWHPSGQLVATGNQDCTTRLWDVRRPDECLAVLPAAMGSIRSCRFSPDGTILAVAEPADFVHLYDVAGGLLRCQALDFFGEISGISFTPDSQALYVGIPDREYTSTLCYLRNDSAD